MGNWKPSKSRYPSEFHRSERVWASEELYVNVSLPQEVCPRLEVEPSREHRFLLVSFLDSGMVNIGRRPWALALTRFPSILNYYQVLVPDM